MNYLDAYIVEYREKDQEYLRRVINPRRGPTLSVPDVTMKTSLSMGDKMLAKFGLDQYVGAVTAEMRSRPIPHIFKSSETKALTDLYYKWAPLIFRRVFQGMEAPTQTYNKVSRLGWKEFTNPPNKQSVLDLHFSSLLQGGLEIYEGSFIIINVRLQPEPRMKERDFMMLDAQGRPYLKKVDAAAREVEVEGMGKRTASRTRAIFNMPIPNLFKQPLDTAIHNYFLRWPTFHHDMFNNRILPVNGFHLCADVKHFERHTADAVRARGEILGGMYGKINNLFSRIPYAVPSDDWKRFYYIWPNRKAGYSDQFASGDSAVAPAQKEIFTAIFAEFFCATRGLNEQQALDLVFRGGDERLTLRNYGDDNSWSGDEVEVMALYNHARQYLTLEIEDPAKFLGFIWVPGVGWRLPVDSYLLKTYLNERRPYSGFRTFPNLGWVLKREVFSKLGVERIPVEVFPYEDVILDTYHDPWYEIATRAESERRQSLANEGQRNVNWVLGKDYRMTAEEKLATGEFIGLLPERTAPILRVLLDKEWLKLTKL